MNMTVMSPLKIITKKMTIIIVYEKWLDVEKMRVMSPLQVITKN